MTTNQTRLDLLEFYTKRRRHLEHWSDMAISMYDSYVAMQDHESVARWELVWERIWDSIHEHAQLIESLSGDHGDGL